MKNEELKSGNGVVLDDKTKYEYGSDLHAESEPLFDPALGKTVAIRVFEFKMNPDPKIVQNFPDKQTLFNTHARQIETILWGDGLIPLEEVSPRVIIDTKKFIYRIFVPCQARLGVTFTDKPRPLLEQLKNGISKHKK